MVPREAGHRETGGPGGLDRDFADQRREPRIPVDAHIDIMLLDETGEPAGGDPKLHRSHAFNLSRCGIGMMTNERLAVGALVAVRVPADIVRDQPNTRTGTVRHCRPADIPGWFAVGIEYADDRTPNATCVRVFERAEP